MRAKKPLLLAAFVLVLSSLPVMPSQGQTSQDLRLPVGYVAMPVDSPNPLVGGNFGIGFVNMGDQNGDGKDDLLAPQFGAAEGQGEVYVLSGADGNTLLTLSAPDPSSQGSPAGFGTYVGALTDLGSCPGGRPSEVCTGSVGAKDGVPDILVGAVGVDVGGSEDIGRAYVIDGASGAVLKRLDMPSADRAEQAALGASPGFGRTVLNPRSPFPTDAPQAVHIGDMNGGGEPDIMVGANDYFDTPASNPSCDVGPCRSSGRAYLYRGEDVVGSDPAQNLDEPYVTVKNPIAQTDDPNVTWNAENFAHSVSPVGDLGACSANLQAGERCPQADATATPDGLPDIVISGHRTDFPRDFFDSGLIYIVQGDTGEILFRHDHPEPQSAAIFGFTYYSQQAIGDVGNTTHPDILMPAIRQNLDELAQGRAYIMNGNFKTGPNAVSFSLLDDPTPNLGGNFGVGSAGLGDVAGDPRNEVLVGAFGPHNPGTDRTFISDIHVMSPLTGSALLSITDPDRQAGSAFGSSVAAMGDLNGDGMIDLAAGADLWDGPAGADQGRIYIFLSSEQVPVDGTPAACSDPGSTSANVILGTDEGESIEGTSGPDIICALGGDDIVRGKGGADIIILGAGDDTAAGGGGRDIIRGGGGRDVLSGKGQNDVLRGGGGDDTLKGNAGFDTLVGGAGNDTLQGGRGDDILRGGDGNDALKGFDGDDILNGGGGLDSCRPGRGDDKIRKCE